MIDQITVNLLTPNPGDNTGDTNLLTQQELQHMERMTTFNTTGKSYAMEHGMRPATIGLVLSASPLSLLAW